MIQQESKIIKAVCDGCGADLLNYFWGADEPPSCNYGLLDNRFGWPSRLDNVHGDVDHADQYHVCEACWEKALAAVGIKVGA